jgi:hypothetical protein
MPEHQVNVRYMVNDVQGSIDWYTKNLSFKLLSNASPAFCGCRARAVAAALKWREKFCGATYARRQQARAGWLESL